MDTGRGDGLFFMGRMDPPMHMRKIPRGSRYCSDGGVGWSVRVFAPERPGRYEATQMRIDPAVAAQSSPYHRTIETTGAMLRAYGLAEPDLTDAVRLLRSTFHGYCALEASGGFGAPRDVQTSWERSVEALHFLLEHWPSATNKGENDD